jgi:uncharacterized protein YjbJ (UPF0337 family)
MNKECWFINSINPLIKEMPMNKEQFKGNWNQFKGELKKKWGKFTDDELMQIEGDYDKFKGRSQELYGDQKEEVNNWVQDWQKKNKRTS